MGRAEGFRLQAGFGVHLHRGCLATSRGCLTAGRGTWPRAAAVSVHNSHNLKPLPRGAWPQAAQPQPFCGNFSSPTWAITCIRSLMVRLVPQSRARAAPTVRLVPQSRARLRPSPTPGCAPAPRQSVHPLSDLCPVPHRNPCAQACTPTLLTPAPPILPLLGFL